jgi:hypothetical protein
VHYKTCVIIRRFYSVCFCIVQTLDIWWASGLTSGETESKHFTCSWNSVGTSPSDGVFRVIWNKKKFLHNALQYITVYTADFRRNTRFFTKTRVNLSYEPKNYSYLFNLSFIGNNITLTIGQRFTTVINGVNQHSQGKKISGRCTCSW